MAVKTSINKLPLKPTIADAHSANNLTNKSNKVSNSIQKQPEDVEVSISIQNDSFELNSPFYEIFALHLNIVKEDASIIK